MSTDSLMPGMAPTMYVAQPMTAQPAESHAPAADDAADDAAQQEERAGFVISRNVFHGMLAGLTSTVFNCAVIIIMALITQPAKVEEPAAIVEAVVNEPKKPEPKIERLTQNFTPSTALAKPSNASAMSAARGVQTSAKVTPVQTPQIQTKVAARPTNVKVNVGTMNVMNTSGAQMVASVPKGTLGEALATADGYGEAMDILTQEILNRLAKNKVLVVWAFDQSLSMKDDQKEIRDRIEKVYAELGLSSATKGDALWTAVTSYGRGYAVHTPKPTNLLKEIREAIDAVPVDESGEEMMCSAVGQSVANFNRFTSTGGGREMVVILVTDESGTRSDNTNMLEPAIKVCKDNRASVYVIGREAVFGYPFAHIWWTVTVPAIGGGTVSQRFLLPIDRGPETPFIEMLQTEGFRERRDAHPSGFGPYEQVRLARETGGMFLMLPTPEADVFQRDTTQFSYEQMRVYLPDIRSREVYAKERDYSPLRAMIWRVINDLDPYRAEVARYINLRLQFDADELAKQIDVEIAKAAQYVKYLDIAEKAMRDGRGLREREKELRWRAHYDLTLAQLVAYKARVYEYGAYLTLFKANPKRTDPPTPTRVLARWDVQERGKTVADQITKPIADDAANMFKQVMADYPGTPWATRAEYELSRGFGIDLTPRYVNPNPTPGPRPVRPIVRPRI